MNDSIDISEEAVEKMACWLTTDPLYSRNPAAMLRALSTRIRELEDLVSQYSGGMTKDHLKYNDLEAFNRSQGERCLELENAIRRMVKVAKDEALILPVAKSDLHSLAKGQD